MWNFNNWSKSLDAYQRLQETQSKLHEFLSSDTTSSVQPDGGGRARPAAKTAIFYSAS